MYTTSLYVTMIHMCVAVASCAAGQAHLSLLLMAGDILVILLLIMSALRLGHHQLPVLLCCHSLMGSPGSLLHLKGRVTSFLYLLPTAIEFLLPRNSGPVDDVVLISHQSQVLLSCPYCGGACWAHLKGDIVDCQCRQKAIRPLMGWPVSQWRNS